MTDASDPHRPKIRAIEAAIAEGRLAAAASALEELRSTAPGDVRVDLVGALLARVAQKPDDEIAALRRAVALVPGWPLPRVELAKALARNGAVEEAVIVVGDAFRLAPTDLSVLETGVAIANESGYDAVAQPFLQAALALRPEDQSIRKALALSLSKQQKFAEAEGHWQIALKRQGDDPFALGWLGTCLMGTGRRADACRVLERAIALEPDNPVPRFSLAVARGETPRTLPAQVTRDLFDGFAHRFDRELVAELGYRVPERVADLIRQRSPALDIGILDLGCGTGLLGAQLGAVGGEFVGVDLSAGMLAQARNRGIYSQLRQSDLLDELRRTPAQSFDYVVSNDVFIYVGDLSEVIPAIFPALRSGGAFIFSCETATAAEGAFVLRPSNRYAHSLASVERLCRQAGFTSFVFEKVALRLESAHASIAGFIATALRA